MWSVHTTEKGGQLLVGTPDTVWRGTIAPAVLQRIVNPVAGARYDLDPGGTRFLVLERQMKVRVRRSRIRWSFWGGTMLALD